MVRERATKNGVSVSLELATDVDLVDGDERRVRQVVFNLLSNAVKFTPRDGSVVVASAREDGEVLVSVTDTGPGIAWTTRNGSSRSSSRRTPASSSARGPGSDSPLEAPRRTAPRPHLGRKPGRTRQPVRLHASDRERRPQWRVSILVVEDNETNMSFVRDVLRAKGYSTLEATTGEGAVELARTLDPAHSC